MSAQSPTVARLESLLARAETEGRSLQLGRKRENIAPINAFAIFFAASMAQIMDKANLSRPALRLLFELMDISVTGNLVSVNQKGLSARIGVSKSSLNRSMLSLVSAGVLLELPHGLFLNPQLISKQALSSMAKNFPREVVAGIEALRAHGMEPNWNPAAATTAPAASRPALIAPAGNGG